MEEKSPSSLLKIAPDSLRLLALISPYGRGCLTVRNRNHAFTKRQNEMYNRF